MKNFKIFSLMLLLSIFLISCSKEESAMEPKQPESKLPTDFQGLSKIFGETGIGAGAWLAKDVVVLFDINASNYAWIENGVVKDIRKVNDENSIFQKLPQSGPSAAVVLKSSLYVFAIGGGSYSSIGFNRDQVQGKWNDPSYFNVRNSNFLLRQWGVDDSSPFKGVSAAFAWHPDRHCDIKVENRERLFHLNIDKPEITTYNDEVGTFSNTVALSNFGLYECTNNIKSGLNLNSIVDAAFIYPVNGKVYEVFFFNNGTDFVYSEIGQNTTSEVYNINM
ncbi:hypothetical protein UMM65_14510 [Aureibaculum sp. 2210JD6-5]|uniref:hypothetical protein n=1 Tax=Aureibaculum sp. 2210JD6-5 TaxID=3103957 RepID=UPI002AAEAB82|nr:hypothetical protein [Aureibaculum sp. 2210JD6-5]MDY7396460.1 hypothetical protein [Aureibaculum sp. 2210JD6-5]